MKIKQYEPKKEWVKPTVEEIKNVADFKASLSDNDFCEVLKLEFKTPGEKDLYGEISRLLESYTIRKGSMDPVFPMEDLRIGRILGLIRDLDYEPLDPFSRSLLGTEEPMPAAAEPFDLMGEAMRMSMLHKYGAGIVPTEMMTGYTRGGIKSNRMPLETSQKKDDKKYKIK